MAMHTAPSAPLDLSSVCLTPTSVTVKWNRPKFPNGIIRSYTVIYQKAAAENHDLYKVIAIKSNSLSVNLTDLQDSVSYIVWVRVVVSAVLIRMHSFKFRLAL